MAEKKAEDLIGSKSEEGKGETAIDGADMVNVNDRPDMLHVTDRPDVLESEKRSDLKKIKAWSDPNDLQAERGGLKVKDSDFKTK